MNRKLIILSHRLAEPGLGSYLRIVRTSRSTSPLEYVSDEDAEGDVDVVTDGSYATPTTSSPVRPEEPIVGDNSPKEPAVERLAGAGSLVPIEEVEEVPDSESDEVPEENKDPLQIREQPPAYSPVRRRQWAMRGGRINGPHNFRRHCFPYAANSDQCPAPTYSQWEIASSKRRRGEDDRAAKRIRVVHPDDEHESSIRCPWPSPGSHRGSSVGPDTRVRSSSDHRGIRFIGGHRNAGGRESSGR